MKRLIQQCILVGALLLGLAAHPAVEPDGDAHKDQDGGNSDALDPDYPYQTLADVPERYHDGEKLTGCFLSDRTSGSGPHFPPGINCYNPFYWDERGILRHIHRPYSPPPKPFPPIGVPRDYQPAPCEGCLDEEQAIDVFRVYHRWMGIEPLVYRASLKDNFPWNGLVNPDYCKTKDPHKNLSPYERVNLPRSHWGKLLERCRDPEGRDLTWIVSFQVGWIETHDIQRKVEQGRYRRSALSRERLPCGVSHVVHAKTGHVRNLDDIHVRGVLRECTEGAVIDSLHNFDDIHKYDREKAKYEAKRRLYLYLPDSPYRKNLRPPAERLKRLRPGVLKQGEYRQKTRESDAPPNHLQHSSTTGSRKQHILVYYGKSPEYDLDHTPCVTTKAGQEVHDSKCKERVPKIKQCDVNNVPVTNPVDGETTYDCILWSRIDGEEECWYTDNGSRIRGWCERKSRNGYTYRGTGITSSRICAHIDAVESLTGHLVGMRYNDPDFAEAKRRLEDLFSETTLGEVGDDDAFAEINLFPPDVWNNATEPEGIHETGGFYIHRFGPSHWDDPQRETQENQQYRRLNSRFDWYTQGAWCNEPEHLNPAKCRKNKKQLRFHYTLVHEGTHDVTESHLRDQFHHPTHWLEAVSDAQHQTMGVLEGHTLFLEEQAGRDRVSLDLVTRRTAGDYRLQKVSSRNLHTPPSELARTSIYDAGENLVYAFRKLEKELPLELDLPNLGIAAKALTRKLFNQTLHLFKPIDDYTGQWNKHVDFCEVRNGIHNRVWVLRRTLNPLAPINEPQPHVSAAFNYASVVDCRFVLPVIGDCTQPDDCVNVTTCSLPSPEPDFFPPSSIKVIGPCPEITIGDLRIVDGSLCYPVRITDDIEILICMKIL